MDAHEVEAVLDGCEAALAGGGPVDLRGLGFWRAVAAVKREPAWIDRYADRIGTIDRLAFQRAVWPRLPLAAGSLGLGLGAALGLALAAAARRLEGGRRDLALLAGAGLLLGTTHDLGHLVVGRSLGIQFTEWFLDGPTRIQPGLKMDYATYLRCPASARAWMHAAGALATKIVPFALLPLADGWSRPALLAIGTGAIATDVLFSTWQSDWKRFRREMRVARASRA
jgi:hypothetical protein